MTDFKKIVFNKELCRDCQACMLACSLLHEGECNLNLARLSVNKDMAKYEFSLQICRHCDSPDCIEACPTDAMRMDERGIVIIQEENCMQCGDCADACPYDGIFYNESRDRYLKCDLCLDRDEGALCVQICPVGALILSGVEVERGV